jgi:hypothetical protein
MRRKGTEAGHSWMIGTAVAYFWIQPLKIVLPPQP